jgi:2-dehydro-3-deoxy-phosphogluconate aldolase
MKQSILFYQDRVAINVLAQDLANAVAVHQAAEGHVAVGLLASRFATVEAGVAVARAWQEHVCVSIGLGAGDPAQTLKAAQIARVTGPAHLNQTFPGAGFAAGALDALGKTNTRVNALIHPSGTKGRVILSTGIAASAAEMPALVDTDTAVLMVRDLGVATIKFFPMGGLASLAELEVLAKSCTRHGMEMIEPTGGITLGNVGAILQVCLDAGVAKVVPHVYSSIIDQASGNTRPTEVAELLQILKHHV